MTAVLASAGLALIAGSAAVGIITATATPAPVAEPTETRVAEPDDSEISLKSEPAPAAETAPAPEATAATETMVVFEYTLTPEEQRLVDQATALDPSMLVPEELNTAIWKLQNERIVPACMSAHGFDYAAYAAAIGPDASARPELLEEWVRSGVDTNAFFIALWGEPNDGPYDWTRAGCHGYAVHITGMDEQQ